MKEGIELVSHCCLKVGDEPWVFAREQETEIKAHWLYQKSINPKFFNGTVYVLLRASLAGASFHGTLARTNFASAIYWRQTGYRDRSVLDAFGTGLLRSSDGGLMLGAQAPGQLNSGFLYPPGGFIDERDVGADGTVDLDGSILRELAEETGLEAGALDREKGYILSIKGPLLSIGVEYRSRMDRGNLERTVRAHLASQKDAELRDVQIVDRNVPAFGNEAIPPYAQQFLGHYFEGNDTKPQ